LPRVFGEKPPLTARIADRQNLDDRFRFDGIFQIFQDGKCMVISGTIKVTAAGASVQAASKGNARSMVFKARNDNTGTCYLGGSDVSATDGMSLVPGESIQLELADAISSSQFWADSANNNDQIDFIGNE
jgi:hypothetical protein